MASLIKVESAPNPPGKDAVFCRASQSIGDNTSLTDNTMAGTGLVGWFISSCKHPGASSLQRQSAKGAGPLVIRFQNFAGQILAALPMQSVAKGNASILNPVHLKGAAENVGVT